MEKAQKRRNSSVELMRIIFAIGVIFLHYNNAGLGGVLQYIEAGTLNEKWIYLTESAFICSVAVFVIISGCYSNSLVKANTGKLFGMIFQTSVFIELFYVMDALFFKEEFNYWGIVLHFLPNHYFVILFCTLSLIAPYINISLRGFNINQRAFKCFLGTIFILLSVEPFFIDCLNRITNYSFQSLSCISAEGSQAGYTLLNFVLLYLLGAAIKILNIRFNRYFCVASILLGISVLWVFSMKSSLAWYYNNPIVIIVAFLIVDLSIQYEFYNKVINELAGASFTCLIFHSWFLRFLGFEKIANGKLYVLILHQFLSGVLLFLCSYLVYKIWAFIWRRIVSLIGIDKLFSRLDLCLYERLGKY